MDKMSEQELQAASIAPRVTPSNIEANINSEHYFTAAHGVEGAMARMELHQRHAEVDTAAGHMSVHVNLGLLTFCVLGLRNGFTVTGESACASQENFNAEIGRRIARENAVDKIWPLMGYELKSSIANR